MRWIWRGESGRFKVEYAALVLMVATIVVAVMSFGIPTRVQAQIDTALCRITESTDCGSPGEYAPPFADGERTPSDAGSESNENSQEDPEGEQSGSDQPDEETGSEGRNTVVYDPAAAQGLVDAHEALQNAKEEQEEAEEAYADLDKELLNLLGELIGLEDAKKCLTEGDIVACIWTVVGFTPWGKGAKVAKKIPKIAKLFTRWRKLKKAKSAAEAKFGKATQRTEKALSKCGDARPKANNRVIDRPSASIDGVPVGTEARPQADPVTAMVLPVVGWRYVVPTENGKKPNLDDLLARAEEEGKSTPSLDDLLASTEGTVCANPSPSSNPGELKQMHTDKAMDEFALKGLRNESTENILDSLKPGKEESLKVMPDGTIMNGNHRIKVLRERGVDVDSLPREIHRRDLPSDGHWD